MSNYEKIKVGLFVIILVIVITFLFNFLEVYKQSINNKNSSHEESIEFLNEKFEKSSTNTIIGTEKEVSYTLTKMDNEIYLIKLNGPQKTIVIYSTSNLSEKPEKIYEGQLD
ncbi:hypothetical protein ACQKCU_10445 [Heyndrickxia sporothermodurans]